MSYRRIIAGWREAISRKPTVAALYNQNMTRILAINEEHFGEDKRRRYLRDDFLRVLLDIVQREVMNYVFFECSKEYHNKIEEKNDKGEIVKVSRGNFDPDNSHFLYSIMRTHDKGFMVNLRQLLAKNELGAGGKFINDITGLTVDDFLEYYQHSKTDKTIIPKRFLERFFANRDTGGKVNVDDFFAQHRSEVESIAKELVLRAKKFNDAGYHHTIIKDYQALELHKNEQREKYDIDEAPDEKFEFMTIKKVTKTSKSKIEPTLISKAMEDFSAITFLYQSLISDNTSFITPNFPLDTHIRRIFELFDKKLSIELHSKVRDDIAKNLPSSLNLVGWTVESSQAR